jgi:hypothetical protein
MKVFMDAPFNEADLRKLSDFLRSVEQRDPSVTMHFIIQDEATVEEALRRIWAPAPGREKPDYRRRPGEREPMSSMLNVTHQLADSMKDFAKALTDEALYVQGSRGEMLGGNDERRDAEQVLAFAARRLEALIVRMRAAAAKSAAASEDRVVP